MSSQNHPEAEPASGGIPSAEPNRTAGTLPELLRVAVPLMLSSGTQSLMNAADRMMLTSYSESSLAAVTPASMMHWTAICIPLGTILYTNTFISQYDGARRPEQVVSSLWQAVWLSLFTGLLLLALLPFSFLVFQAFDHVEEVVQAEVAYFNTLCAGSPVLLLATALSCFFNGRRRSEVVLIVSLIAVLVNCVMDYLLVYGIGGLPELGIRGAALATVLARCLEVVIYAVLIRRELRTWHLPRPVSYRPQWGLLVKYVRFGVPSGLHYFVDNAGFTVFLLILGKLSQDALAATNLAFSVNGLIFVPLLGFGTAIQTLVGSHLGAGHPAHAQSTTRLAAWMGLLWTGVTGLVLVLFPQFCLSPFAMLADRESLASVEELIRSAAPLLYFVALYSMFDALAVVYSSALRGAGDTVFPMLLNLFSSWLILVLPAWLLVQSRYASSLTLWSCCAAHIGFTGIAMGLRYRSGRWRQFRLTESTPDEFPAGHSVSDRP